MSSPKPPLLTLRTMVLLLVAIAVGAGAGILTYLSGQHPAAAIIAGTGTFGGVLIWLNTVVE